jgi:hypothetical protein
MKKYTCTDYRQEMILAGLKRQLAQSGLSKAERDRLNEQIRQLESEMGMD